MAQMTEAQREVVLSWEQKFHALNSLAEAQLMMRKPGDWYVSQSVEVKDANVLIGEYGNGATPEAAVEDHWKRLTNLKPHQYLVTNAGDKERRAHWRWSVCLWERIAQLPESQP